jgi:aminoglycoside phosphotransferase (APT) family kinase protein
MNQRTAKEKALSEGGQTGALHSTEPIEGAPFSADTAVKHRKHLLGAVDFASWSDRLKRFFERQPGVLGDVTISDIHLPSAGGSSGTLMFAATFDTGRGSSKREFVLRYATEGGLFHTYNLRGQYEILAGLTGSAVPVPAVIGIDADGDVLGVTGYVMERVNGEVSPPSYFKSGLIFEASAEDRERMIFDVVATLAKLHALDWRTLKIDFLAKRGNGSTAIERDLDWHWNSLLWGCPEEAESLEPIRQWLLANQPDERNVCLNHGDCMLANYMFRDNRVAAVLDWELAFLGNPANDLAYQIFTHSILGLGCEPLPGFPSEQEWKAEYERVTGHELADWDYFFAVAAFKVHITMLLVFRAGIPELEAARRAVREFTWQSLVARKAKFP